MIRFYLGHPDSDEIEDEGLPHGYYPERWPYGRPNSEVVRAEYVPRVGATPKPMTGEGSTTEMAPAGATKGSPRDRTTPITSTDSPTAPDPFPPCHPGIGGASNAENKCKT